MYAVIDCNNFFASCERLFRPDLQTKPVAVLSNNDGCIIARSQEVKALDIPMGIPLFKVKPLVRQHDITLFSANFELYGDISERIVMLLREVTPLIEVYSIDECFLDLSELAIESYDAWGRDIKERIMREIGIPVSVGIGPTKTLAKVATTYAKQHGGVYVVTDNTLREAMLGSIPVGDVWGIGWRMAPKLRELGVSTALQLINASDAWLRQQFTITGLRMVDELRGQPRLGFGDKHEQRKSIMCSRSFGHKVRELYQLESAASNFAARAAARLREQGSVCSVIAIYLTTGHHVQETRRVSTSVRLSEATADTGRIITAALEALQSLYDPDFAYKKVAVTLLEIVDRHDWQLSLTDPVLERDARTRLMRDMDTVNKTYGASTIWHGSEDHSHARWHSRHALRSPRYTTSWGDVPTVGLYAHKKTL